MGFELHLCSLSFAREKTYVIRKLKSVSFPSSINCLPQEIQALANGLLCLLDMSLIVVKRLATQGTKRKSMDIFMASSSTKSKNDCLTEVLWDKIDADDMEDELSDGDDGEDEIDEDDIQEKIDGNNEE
ncbi:hypothetical protein HMPREF1544_00773 [Mucor circinelloides 1006PhL]|uniref:Uncharacterized protein n=1 Tax=Mucor circinelloides f. circinelloides (strain 1006PhL) TaxID=1220926 RepID=S2KJ70_MUCC1|nr:hypothetical protein HMPREF1544_00773 [Mucor circinelloides 1006PhL]